VTRLSSFKITPRWSDREPGDLSPVGSKSTTTRLRWLLPLAVVLYALAFQGWRPLYSPDEGRYTDVALNMIATGDWMRPMLHPEVEHWAKPPLTYWSIAASIVALGRSEFAARLPGALAFALTCLLLARIGRRLVPAQPWLPAIVYATFAFPAVASNLVTTDTLLAFWETLGALAFVEFWSASDENRQRLWRCVFWFAAAMAFMTKGPPGLLVLLASMLFAAISERWPGVRRLFAWDALVLFIVVGGAWYLDVVLREPRVWRYFLVEEVVNRVATDKMHRNAEWYGAFKVYGPTLVLGTLPWLAFVVRKVIASRRTGDAATERNDGTLFLRCWFLLPLAVFALSRSRLPLYILPLFAPLALVAARMLAPVDFRGSRLRIALGAWCLVLVACRVIPAYLDIQDDDRALANALRDHAPALPEEVAFVEIEPRFGLRFYLGSEIERLDLPGDPDNPRAQNIASEMLENEGCRLLLVPPRSLKRLRDYLADHAIAYRALPDARDFAVLAQSTPDCPQYANR
jgi:4-amino-4-deoxy-L-arabinose transferase